MTARRNPESQFPMPSLEKKHIPIIIFVISPRIGHRFWAWELSRILNLDFRLVLFGAQIKILIDHWDAEPTRSAAALFTWVYDLGSAKNQCGISGMLGSQSQNQSSGACQETPFTKCLETGVTAELILDCSHNDRWIEPATCIETQPKLWTSWKNNGIAWVTICVTNSIAHRYDQQCCEKQSVKTSRCNCCREMINVPSWIGCCRIMELTSVPDFIRDRELEVENWEVSRAP